MTLRAAVLWAALAAPAAGAVVLPAEDFAPGWKRAEAARTFAGPSLFDHIDGGAELYLEFGFRALYLQRYAKGEDELVCEVYEMTDPGAAFGLYLSKCGRETPLASIAARNSSEAAQFTILKGRYFLHVNNPSGREDLVPAMTALANRALAPLEDGSPPDLLSRLPAEGLVPGSALLFRGPIGLQSVVTLGEGDILDQRGGVFGVAGRYAAGGTAAHSLVLVDYPDVERANRAFAGLAAGLDPYLEVLERSETAFVFEDFKKEFGFARLSAGRIEVRVGLRTRPVL